MNKKILFITPGLGKGGAETQLLKVARYLKSHGHEIMIIALRPFNNFDINYEAEGISAVFYGNWQTRFPGNLLKLYRTVKNYKPDTVMAFMFAAIIIGRLLRIFIKFYLISSIRISEIDRKWKLLFRLTSNLKLDNEIVYNSYASKSNFENKALVKKKGIVINNAITVPVLERNSTEESGIKTFKWICVAHFRANKDYATLFNALAIIKDRNYSIDILGHLHGQKWPHRMISDLGIAHKVNLLGFQSNVSYYLKQADAFVLSSFSEGMPNAILEAMAYEKPIVASSIDGIEEIIENSAAGFLFQPGNKQDLADKMAGIMSTTREERYCIGEKGRQYIENNFAEKIVLDKWLEVALPQSRKPVIAEAVVG